MKITPLAFDSMGTRSMCTFIETKDARILIDPGVSLAPSRYGLPPHSLELARLAEHWNSIKEHARKADVLIVTHYHYDHHNPDAPEIYKGKSVFLKHPEEHINLSQKGRAKYFLERLGKLPKKIEFSDGREFSFGKTKLKFSPAVFHGDNDKLGYVTEVLIDDGKTRFIHTSDVEGPCVKEQLDFILRNKPDVVFLDGPLSYMLYRFGMAALSRSIQNMIHIVQEARASTLVVEHHFLRDHLYRERLAPVMKAAEKTKGKCKVMTAAEFAGKEIEMLEAKRKELYTLHPERASGKPAISE